MLCRNALLRVSELLNRHILAISCFLPHMTLQEHHKIRQERDTKVTLLVGLSHLITYNRTEVARFYRNNGVCHKQKQLLLAPL